MGGGGHVTADIHRLTASGLRNVLRRFEVIDGEFVTRASLGLPEQTLLRATEDENFMVAPESGYFEVFVDLGQRVAVDEPVGQMHFLERPDRPPEVILSKTSGIVCVVRSIAVSARATPSSGSRTRSTARSSRSAASHNVVQQPEAKTCAESRSSGTAHPV